MTLDDIIAAANGTLAGHLRQRDWEAVAYLWDTTGGFHGLPVIKPEWRQFLIDEAARDDVDLLAAAEAVDQPARPAGRPPLYGDRMEAHTVMFTAAQWQQVQARGGAAYLRQLIDADHG